MVYVARAFSVRRSRAVRTVIAVLAQTRRGQMRTLHSPIPSRRRVTLMGYRRRHVNYGIEMLKS